MNIVEVTEENLKRCFAITQEALAAVRAAEHDRTRKKIADDYLDMAQRYFDDAQHFFTQGNFVLAYGALHYAHAWLDAGARIGLFKVSDSRLFTVDD
ncbi:MAG: DUF357 domain-containing protein [archaeon]